MRVDLKSGEYYDYYNIKRVEILDNDVVKIIGSFAKGTKSKTAQVHLRTIKNIREFNRFLKKEMKFYQVDGECQHCGSLNVESQGATTYRKKLNDPKHKMIYGINTIITYKCNSCKKLFNDLKYVNLVIYTK